MRRIGLGLLILALAGGAGIGRAAAIEVTCIEASKYKHLYKIFGGDARKFAAYLQIDPGRLPGPEHCRAALVSGKVELPAAQDVARLADIIVQNEGWLATLHLSSTGGSLGAGYQLGFLARNFWLKTTTARVTGTALLYTPDFFVPPLGGATAPVGTESTTPGPAAAPPAPTPEADLAQGWQAYLAEQRKLAPVQASPACISACGLIHAAGIERFGVVRLHRSRYSGEDAFIDQSQSMTITNEGLMRSEETHVAFYRQMDAGPDFISTFQSTPPETTMPVDVSRYPRYVADYLNARCSTDVGQLQRLERQIELSISYLTVALFGPSIKVDRLRGAMQKVREQRSKAEQCVAAAHEKERLAAYDRICKGGCNKQKLAAMAREKMQELARAAR
ncbi:MAG: hypothetical protein K2Z80_20910 [Xanthobacteraceae bacterium]|nr:hypothetical protein [Xanthobacteraceae bacterium]